MNTTPPRLTLYVAGESPPSRRARTNLAAALERLRIGLSVRVVDVYARPDEALTERIYVTPALLLQTDGQREMLVGDLSQREALEATLAPLQAGGLDTLEGAA